MQKYYISGLNNTHHCYSWVLSRSTVPFADLVRVLDSPRLLTTVHEYSPTTSSIVPLKMSVLSYVEVIRFSIVWVKW